ncbi:hypothetical protein D3C76_1663400 [compost metagenome]
MTVTVVFTVSSKVARKMLTVPEVFAPRLCLRVLNIRLSEFFAAWIEVSILPEVSTMNAML